MAENNISKKHEYRKLKLVKGGFTLVDAEDYERLLDYGWMVNAGGYAYSTQWNREQQKYETIYLQRLLTDAPKGMVVDHLNHKRLDNRKSNLRVCTHGDNMRNLAKGRGCIQKIASTAGNIFYRGKVQQHKKEYRTPFVSSKAKARKDLEVLKLLVLGEYNGTV